MTLAVQIIAIIFMLTFIFIGIWSFIIANKAYSQAKYKNYLLEKISNQLSLVAEASLDIDKTTVKFTQEQETEENEILNTYIPNEDVIELTKELIETEPLFKLEKENIIFPNEKDTSI
ncbi:MAG: hypothetical protein ACRC41_12160 [Sarcina sp.]